MIRLSNKQRMVMVENLDDVPSFASEAEEAAYWDTHELGGEALERMRPLSEVLREPQPGKNGPSQSDAP